MGKFVTKIISQTGRFMQEGKVNKKPPSNVSTLHDSRRDNYPVLGIACQNTDLN